MYCHIHHCHYHHCNCVPTDSTEKGGALTLEELVAYTQEMKEELKDYTVDLKDQIFSYIDVGLNPVEINNSINSLREQDTYILRTLTNKIDELNNTTNLSMFNLRTRVTDLEGQSATIIQDLEEKAERLLEAESNILSLNRNTIVLNSVEDFTSLDSIKTDGLRVYVKSRFPDLNRGGGFFSYDESRVNDEDGGTVFKGWVRENNVFLSVEYFCKCDGLEETAQILKAVEAANTNMKALRIPYGLEVLVGKAAVLEPKYGLYGGGRLRRIPSDWDPYNALVRLNSPESWIDNITIVTDTEFNRDINDIPQSSDIVAKNASIEVTKNAVGYSISNCTIIAGWSGIWVYGGKNGRIEGNKIRKQRLFGITFGSNSDNRRPEDISDITDNTLIYNNEISHVSSIAFDRDTGDGIKVESHVKNTIISNNIIHSCQRDCIDVYASGELIHIADNILYGSNRGIDIKESSNPARYIDYGVNHNIVIRGNIIHNNEYRGIIVSSSGGKPQGVIIQGNTIHSHEDDAIWFNGVHGQIVDNTLYNNATMGRSYGSAIKIDKSSNYDPETSKGSISEELIIARNLCFNNGGGSSNQYSNNSAICIIGGSRKIIVESNQCYNIDAENLDNRGGQHYGIVLRASDGIVLRNNLCRGNLLLPFWWNASFTKVLGERTSIRLDTLSPGRNYLGILPPNSCVTNYSVYGNNLVGTESDHISYQLFYLKEDGSVTSLGNRSPNNFEKPINTFPDTISVNPMPLDESCLSYLYVTDAGQWNLSGKSLIITVEHITY